jgi:hypothetical protein
VGLAFALGVPPGPVQAGAYGEGVAWPDVTVQVAPDAVTDIQLWR